MEIYFKKLTQDLLEVCRMLDDKPEVKNKLSEIAVDVSLLPDIGYSFDKWAAELPQKDGYYWASGPEIEGVTLVEITDGDLFITGWEGEVDPGHYQYWLGPIPEPKAPETEKQDVSK